MMILSTNSDTMVDILVLLKQLVDPLSNSLRLKKTIGILTMDLQVKIQRSLELHQRSMQFSFQSP